jgi:hypothetical protein
VNNIPRAPHPGPLPGGDEGDRRIAPHRAIHIAEGQVAPSPRGAKMDAAGASRAKVALLNKELERRLEARADPKLRQIALWRL